MTIDRACTAGRRKGRGGGDEGGDEGDEAVVEVVVAVVVDSSQADEDSRVGDTPKDTAADLNAEHPLDRGTRRFRTKDGSAPAAAGARDSEEEEEEEEVVEDIDYTFLLDPPLHKDQNNLHLHRQN